MEMDDEWWAMAKGHSFIYSIFFFFRIYTYSRVVVAVLLCVASRRFLGLGFPLDFEWRSPSIKKTFN